MLFTETTNPRKLRQAIQPFSFQPMVRLSEGAKQSCVKGASDTSNPVVVERVVGGH